MKDDANENSAKCTTFGKTVQVSTVYKVVNMVIFVQKEKCVRSSLFPNEDFRLYLQIQIINISKTNCCFCFPFCKVSMTQQEKETKNLKKEMDDTIDHQTAKMPTPGSVLILF